jgi:putative glutamine amidotransferase
MSKPLPSKPPRIAVLLDENTSGDGTRYEANKAYFRAVADAGGLPYGVPYIETLIAPTVTDFDGFLAVGGGFAYPADFYIAGTQSPYKTSERYAFEASLMRAFLDADKPVLGICAGMQLLACLHGAKLHGDVQSSVSAPLPHYSRDEPHAISLVPGSRLYAAVGRHALDVNSFHKEAIGSVSPAVRVAARATDGVIEAIEIPAYRFALGLQWHQERYAGTTHAGHGVFEAFIAAATEAQMNGAAE